MEVQRAAGRFTGRRNSVVYVREGSCTNSRATSRVLSNKVQKQRVCRYWLSGKCLKGRHCNFLHSWSDGHRSVILAKLEGHKKAVTGIALPSQSDKLYSASSDGTVRIWNCHSGECERLVCVGAEIGCLVSEGTWVFIGLTNRIRCWNIQDGSESDINTLNVGKIHTIAVSGDTLFVGAQDGSITALKAEATVCHMLSFKVIASLRGHTGAVMCLKTGAAGRLYSGSKDREVRVWNIVKMQCVSVLKGHTDEVTSLLRVDRYIISGSLDCTIKIWTDDDDDEHGMKEVYMHRQGGGVIALHGLNDVEGKPVLHCSCNDDTTYVYELPSFAERGRIFGKKSIWKMETGPGNLLFTGDGCGALTVWKLQPVHSNV